MGGFGAPRELADIMRTFLEPWGICGGWSIDLSLGRVTREHKDVEAAILREHQLPLQRLLSSAGWSMEEAMDEGFTHWRPGEFIELPVHCIWCRNKKHAPRFFEILLNESRGSEFVYRRDPRVRLDLDAAFPMSPSGVRILAPEIVLLYKAKHTTALDEADFRAVLASLGAGQKVWLGEALRTAHPGHRWLHRLGGA